MELLKNLFGKKHENVLLSRNELAKILKLNPEALEQFEVSYREHIMDNPELPDNFFEVNAKQAAGQNDRDVDYRVEQMIESIVQELMTQTESCHYGRDGARSTLTWPELPDHVVTKEEIMELPLGIRPQLTGTLMSRDIKDESYKALLMNYQESRTNPDPKQRKMFYNLFRQGLDILDLDDITYAMIGTNPNSMGHWLPALAKAVGKQEFFRIPETTIINVPVTLLQLTRMEYGQLTPTTIQIVDRFCEHVFNLDEEQEYFIKTGTYSSKFDFRNAWVHGAKEVHELGEYLLFIHHQACMMASPLTKPIIYGVSTTNEWVVREFIPDKEENPKIYKGLPLHTEYRVFVDFDEGEVLAVAPYWDPETMKTRFSKGADSQTPDKIHDYFIYQVHEDTLMRRFEEHKNEVREKIQAMLPDIDLHGQWSIDVMQNGEDFWLIDMAIAANSALCEYVPKGRLKAPEENWIPDFHVSETEDER